MSLLELADVVVHMSKVHVNILKTMEKAMDRFEYVPLQYIAKKVGVKPRKLEEIMDWLVDKRLLKKREADYVGYSLTFKGLDALAIKELARFGVITQVGPKIGMGKEGDIWVVYLDGKPRILKLFRAGRDSFKRVSYHRYYLVPRRKMNKLQLSKLFARNEFKALVMLYQNGVHVPRPIARNRHVIVMEYIDGKELVKTILLEPEEIFKKIIREIAKALKAGMVHADLSEYNVMVTADGEVYLIDWPQYIVATHPDAPKYFERDVKQIVKYFSRKYRIDDAKLLEIARKEFEKEGLDDSFRLAQ